MFNLYGYMSLSESVLAVSWRYAIVAVSQLSPCMHTKPDIFGWRVLVLKLDKLMCNIVIMMLQNTSATKSIRRFMPLVHPPLTIAWRTLRKMPHWSWRAPKSLMTAYKVTLTCYNIYCADSSPIRKDYWNSYCDRSSPIPTLLLLDLLA